MYIKLVDILEGWGGGYFCVKKMEILGEEGSHKIPSVVGYGYFLELPVHIAKGSK